MRTNEFTKNFVVAIETKYDTFESEFDTYVEIEEKVNRMQNKFGDEIKNIKYFKYMNGRNRNCSTYAPVTKEQIIELDNIKRGIK